MPTILRQLSKALPRSAPALTQPSRPFLAEGWAFERLEVVLRAILRAAAFELIGRGDIPARVTITEYVEIARGFFAGKEPGFVNGLLDKLARQLRPEEFTTSSGDGGDTQASQGR